MVPRGIKWNGVKLHIYSADMVLWQCYAVTSWRSVYNAPSSQEKVYARLNVSNFVCLKEPLILASKTILSQQRRECFKRKTTMTALWIWMKTYLSSCLKQAKLQQQQQQQSQSSTSSLFQIYIKNHSFAQIFTQVRTRILVPVLKKSERVCLYNSWL